MNDSWRPEGRVSWNALAIVGSVLLVGSGATAAFYTALASAEDKARQIVDAKHELAKDTFATQTDVAVLQVQLSEAIRLLQEIRDEQRRQSSGSRDQRGD